MAKIFGNVDKKGDDWARMMCEFDKEWAEKIRKAIKDLDEVLGPNMDL